MTVTRGIQMKKGSQHMRKAPIRKTRVIEAFASFDIISGSVLRALLVGGLSRWMHWKNFVYDEESDHSNKAVRKTPEIESGHKVSEEVK